VEWTGLRAAEQHRQRIDVLASVVQPEAKAFDKRSTGASKRIKNAMHASFNLRNCAEEKCLHRWDHHRGILGQPMSMNSSSPAAERPEVIV
jgi:hypothetical protein